MSNSQESDASRTSATLLLRLKQDDVAHRALAWQEFHARYAPVIAGFARRMRAKPQDIDDVVQDVMLGFYALSPTFVYDPAKGRFRGYLKRCALHALMKRIAKDGKYQGLPSETAEEIPQVAEAWDTEWAHQQMHRALEEVRRDYADNHTFRAFELNVLLNLPAMEVAARLGIQPHSVHKAKQRITDALREKIKAMEGERKGDHDSQQSE